MRWVFRDPPHPRSALGEPTPDGLAWGGHPLTSSLTVPVDSTDLRGGVDRSDKAERPHHTAAGIMRFLAWLEIAVPTIFLVVTFPGGFIFLLFGGIMIVALPERGSR